MLKRMQAPHQPIIGDAQRHFDVTTHFHYERQQVSPFTADHAKTN
jgi:hypothetical protein